MSTAVRIRNNSVFSLLSQVLRIGTNIALFVGIARFYGRLEFGEFTTAHAYLVTFFYILADFGIDLLLLTEVARNKDGSSDALERLMPIKLMFCAGALILMAAVAAVVPVGFETKILMWVLSFSILGNGLTNFFLSGLKGFELFQYDTLVSFIQNISLLLFLIGAGLFRFSIVVIAAGFVVSRYLGLFYIIRIFFSVSGRRIRFSMHEWRQTLKKVMPYGIHLLFGTLFFTVDTIIISFALGEKAVGSYQAVFKIVALASVGSDIVTSAFVPFLSRLFAESIDAWKNTLRLLMKVMVVAGLAFGLFFFLFSEWCLTVVYGRNMFPESVPVMKIFGLIIFFRYSVESFGLMLTTSMKQDVRMKIVIIAAVFNIVLNVLSIGKYGITGVACVSLLTNILVGTLFLISARRYFMIHTFLLNRLFVSLVVLTSVCIWGVTVFLNGSMAAAVGLSALCMAAWMAMWFSQYDRNQILRLLSVDKLGM